MFEQKVLMLSIAMIFAIPARAIAGEAAELQQIRNEIKQLKESYEARIQALETRLKQTEIVAVAADQKATQAAAMPSPTAPVSANAFNPDISLILSGVYANLSQNPDNYRITGYIPSGEIGPGKRGFSLAESELGIYANIDPDYYGGLNLAMHPDNTVSVEEAYVQRVGLRNGVTVKAGRFFSGIGYLNEKHAHVWDFVDNPLVYQAFLGNQLGEDGVQVKWLAPTDQYLEIGAELGRGKNFPGSDRSKNGAGAGALFAHLGGDIGVSQSWRAGLSLLSTSPKDREYTEADITGTSVKNTVSGSSRLWLADFVWKYAPNGNASRTSFKLQGEYMQRKEDGRITYDAESASSGKATDSYQTAQSGWYVQGIYKLMSHWRVGLRTERLSSGGVDYAANNANLLRPDYSPSKNSLMLDYTPSEYSRIRLQLAQDKSREGQTDNQLFLQYVMSLGAHGAHQF